MKRISLSGASGILFLSGFLVSLVITLAMRLTGLLWSQIDWTTLSIDATQSLIWAFIAGAFGTRALASGSSKSVYKMLLIGNLAALVALFLWVAPQVEGNWNVMARVIAPLASFGIVTAFLALKASSLFVRMTPAQG